MLLNNFQVEMRRQSGLPTVLTPDLGIYTFHFNQYIHTPKGWWFDFALAEWVLSSCVLTHCVLMLCNAPCVPVDEA